MGIRSDFTFGFSFFWRY